MGRQHPLFLADTHAQGCTTTGRNNRADAKGAKFFAGFLYMLCVCAVIFRAGVKIGLVRARAVTPAGKRR